MTLSRVFCGVARAQNPAGALDVAMVDSAGMPLGLFIITDDAAGYAALRLSVARRQNDGTITLASNEPGSTVVRLCAAAGGAVTVVDSRVATDWASRFAAGQRAVGLAQALRIGAVRGGRMNAPADLEASGPALAAHGALVMGRINAERTLREVLQALYPAVLLAFPNPSAPVTLAILAELDDLDPSAPGDWAQRVAARIRSTGSADQIEAALGALVAAIRQIPPPADQIPHPVRDVAAAVQSIDAAMIGLVASLKPPPPPPPPARGTMGRATVMGIPGVAADQSPPRPGRYSGSSAAGLRDDRSMPRGGPVGVPRGAKRESDDRRPWPGRRGARSNEEVARAAVAGAGASRPVEPADDEFPDPYGAARPPFSQMDTPTRMYRPADPAPEPPPAQNQGFRAGTENPPMLQQRAPVESPTESAEQTGTYYDDAWAGHSAATFPKRARPEQQSRPVELSQVSEGFSSFRGVAPGAVEPAKRDRVLLAHMPARVGRNVEFSLVVRIARDAAVMPGARVASLARLVVRDQPVPVTIVVQASVELRAETESQQVITVPVDRDPEPVRFGFRATATGAHHVRVSAFAGGTFLTELTAHVAVTESGAAEEGAPVSAVIDRIEAEPGEVALQVSAGPDRYSFQLLSDRTWYEPVVVDALAEQPDDAVARAIGTLQQLADGSMRDAYTPANTRRWMREAGTGLWSSMIPPLIQEQFWALRSHMTSFSVAAGNDRVPWEMLYPLSSTRDEGFLVESVPVLRRAYNQQRARVISARDAHFVVPPKSTKDALDEVERLRRILGAPGEPRIVSDLSEILDLIDSGKMGLAHFACHNTFDDAGSRIKMAGGPFVPGLLNSAVTRRLLERTRPLVFLNACRTAGAIPEYTRMMGWASQFMGAGAGAFVGTLWSVRSASSVQFAERFYGELLSGRTLGQATLSARLALGQELGDPTWLAYTIYGDPRATAAL